MSAIEPGRPPRNYRPAIYFLYLIIVIGLLGGAYYVWPRFESQRPQITFAPDSDVMGLAPMVMSSTDQGTGLKSVTATLTSRGSEHELASEQYAQPVAEKKITVALSSRLRGQGRTRGPARQRAGPFVVESPAWQRSRDRKNITIDITPPTLELFADDRYINFGGVG